MKDIIKQIAGYAAVAIVAFITGLFVALNTAGQSGYLKINYGVNENGTPKEISILKPDITDYDYKNIPDYKASALCTKFKKLEYDDNLSEHLRDLRDSYAGPFQKKLVEVYSDC